MGAGQKYDRQYSHFDACIDLLTMPVDQFSPFHPQQSPILGSPDRIADFFIEPFILDLEDEILERSTPDQKADLLKRYLSRLRKSKNHLTVHESKTNRGVNEQGTVAKDIQSVLLPQDGLLIMDIHQNDNADFKFIQGCNILYHLLFDELQKCCAIYDIPFADICLKLGFPLDTINIKVPSPDKLNLPNQVIEVPKGAIEKLKLALQENGFLNVPKVRDLNEQSREELVKLICSNDVPYKIAMFDHLGFTDYFLSEYGSTRTDMYKKFSEIFCAGNRPVSVRAIQGNMNDLRKNTTNRDPRYTASQHREEVKKHYETLK